jgi:hypothetical protein
MIQRFEDEFPDARIQPTTDSASVHSSAASTSPPASTFPNMSTSVTENGNQESDEDEQDGSKPLLYRHNSDVSIASRALSLEEGRLHRLGHRVRTEILNASRPSSSHSASGTTLDNAHMDMSQANNSGTLDDHQLPAHIQALREKYLAYSGEEIRNMTEEVGWEKAFGEIMENAEELRVLEREDPEGFRRFRESQLAALRNREPSVVEGGEGAPTAANKRREVDESAIEE